VSIEENKELVRRVIEEAFNKGNLSAADDCLAANYILRLPSAEYKGVEGFKQMVTMMRSTFPDLHYTIDDMVAEGDRVAARLTCRGTHKNEFMGIPPTGNQVTFTEATFVRFDDGKEVEVLVYTDSLAWYQQLRIPLLTG